MTTILVILLAAVWGALFLPALLRTRRSASPIVSVGMFRTSMRALSGGRSGRWVVMPLDAQDKERMRRETVARRRKTFLALLWTAGASLILGLIPGLRFLLTIHLMTDLALAGFVAYLIWDRRTGAQESYRPRHSAQDQQPEEEFAYLQASQF